MTTPSNRSQRVSAYDPHTVGTEIQRTRQRFIFAGCTWEDAERHAVAWVVLKSRIEHRFPAAVPVALELYLDGRGRLTRCEVSHGCKGLSAGALDILQTMVADAHRGGLP